ncbi:MAG: DUF1566 domain-containing protein [Saprospiraceae bacterium]|nr:DUF1566 domain-containing protein [Saprospiraceae bacterium]
MTQRHLLFYLFLAIANSLLAQNKTKSMLKLPDTGQTGDFTPTFGEDSDYSINPPAFIKHNNGTVTDTVTGLMWQQADGGEMTVENARIYADTLTLAGYTDWRLPTAQESYSILNHNRPNPAVDITVFTSTGAEYWWTKDVQANDATKIWVTNAGGGVGNHTKTETISAGGTKKYHARVVRDVRTPQTVAAQFTDLGNNTIRDNLTGLIWQKTPNPDTLTWENALQYAENLSLGGASDWRLPNIKELQSISDVAIVTPSVSTTFFPTIGIKKYWSSTTLTNQPTRAWYLNTQFGITTYDLKTLRLAVLCVRGSSGNTTALKDPLSSVPLFFKTYPNPSSSEITLDFAQITEGGVLAVSVFNVLGQMVFQNRLQPAQNLVLNKKTMSQGVFQVVVRSEKGVGSQWIVFE